MTSEAGIRAERRVTALSIVVNAGLGLGKTGVGLAGHSTALIADGLHSLSDLASDLAVLWAIRAARRPADADHHYGHQRYESLVTLFVGFLLVAAALYVGIHSLVTLGERHTGPLNWWPFWVAVASILLKEVLFWLTRTVGRRTSNRAVIANAWHHRTDSFSSVAAAAGIAGTLLGGPRWQFLDHLTGVVLATFLVYVGVRIARDAARELSDRSPDPEEQQRMAAVIGSIPGITGFHALRARRSGGLVEVDIHVLVDGNITVRAGHSLASEVESRLYAEFPEVASVVVHVEPADSRPPGP
ncbi:cation transporter [candidate division WOR-3 bacterium]|nr:cation transporter [candidate division WOR-3 bacterium]